MTEQFFACISNTIFIKVMSPASAILAHVTEVKFLFLEFQKLKSTSMFLEPLQACETCQFIHILIRYMIPIIVQGESLIILCTDSINHRT